MTTRLFAGLVLAVLGWFGIMVGVTLATDAAPALVVVLPPARLTADLPEDARLLDGGGWTLTLAGEAGLARRLYANGAWLVLPAGLTGCLPLTDAARARLAGA